MQNSAAQLLNKDQGLFGLNSAGTVTLPESYVNMSSVDSNGYTLISFT